MTARTVVLAAAVAVLGGALGCTAPDALPTMPSAPDQSAWQTVYPQATAQPLRAAWGLDPDDMWAVGDHGAIVHHDGRHLRTVASPTDGHLIAMAGRARDTIWAASVSGEILTWDGRRWTIAHTLAEARLTCLNLVGNDLYAGGLQQRSSDWRAGVWRFDGDAWFPMSMPDDAASPIIQIWATSDGRLLATTGSQMYVHDGRRWLENQYAYVAAIVSGTSALLRVGVGAVVLGEEVEPGRYAPLCWAPLPAFTHLLSSRVLLAGDRFALHRFVGCSLHLVHASPFEIHALVAPAGAGPQGNHAFIAGADGSLTRLFWRDDQTLEATPLTPAPTARLLDQLAGTSSLLATVDWQGRVLAYEDGAWRVVATPWPVARIADAAGGGLVLRGHEEQLAVGDGRGPWLTLPACPDTPREVWATTDGHVRAMSFDLAARVWRLWGLDGGVWSLLSELSESWGLLEAFVGLAPDHLYALFAKNDVRWLLHHDGEAWREALPDDDLSVRRIAAAPRSGSLYLEAVQNQSLIDGQVIDGVFVPLAGPALGWDELVEVAPGLVIARRDDDLRWRAATPWQSLPVDGAAPLRRLWAHEQHGLYVITDHDHILHRNLPERDR